MIPEKTKVCHLSTPELVDRIVQFTEALTETQLYAYQSLFVRRIVESVLLNDGAVITGLWARQCGKTEAVAAACIGMAIILPALSREFPDDDRLSPFYRGFWAGIYAPIDDQAKISFERMRSRVKSEFGEIFLADPELDVHLSTDRSDILGFSNGSVVAARTASPTSSIEGKTWHLVICEESQKLSRTKVEKEIRPMLASTNGTMVHIGTAWEARGGFHNTIQLNVDRHLKGGVRNHFEFPYDIVIKEKRRAYEKTGKSYHLNYEKFVEQEKANYGGESSAEFRMNFMCVWQESRVIAVRASIFLSETVQRQDLEAGRHGYGFQVGGLDIGKTIDSTVLTTLLIDRENPIQNRFYTPGSDEDKQFYYQKTIIDWAQFEGAFETDVGQYRQIVDYVMGTNIQILVIDATGVGDPVYERLQAILEGKIVCVPFKFSSLSKSHLYKYYLTELHSGRLRYPAGPGTRDRFEFRKFQQEHLDLDKADRGGYSVCMAPEGGHDDYPDSAALATWAEKIADEVQMPWVEQTDSPLAPRGGGESRRGFMGQQITESSRVGGRAERYRR